MDDMEQKLNAILGNPEMMSQLMAMAQSMGQQQDQETATPASAPSIPSLPAGLDMQTLQKVASIAAQSGIDKHQQALLVALGPYLNHDRIVKLEKAMRAAKMASLATTVLGSHIPLLPFGR